MPAATDNPTAPVRACRKCIKTDTRLSSVGAGAPDLSNFFSRGISDVLPHKRAPSEGY